MNALRPPQKYRVTVPQYVRSGVFSLFLLGCYHLISWILYTFLLTTLENQMIGDEHEPQYRFVMFGFSLITLVALAAVSYVFYLKNGNRKRAFLAATSVEERPGEDISDGYREYRHAAFYETVISTAITALVWLPSAIFYTAALASSGMGYGYADAWFVESFFVGVIGLYQPFQNAWVGGFLGLLLLGACGYFGRLYAHATWDKHRIRR
jgi:hypothetical protein